MTGQIHLLVPAEQTFALIGRYRGLALYPPRFYSQIRIVTRIQKQLIADTIATSQRSIGVDFARDIINLSTGPLYRPLVGPLHITCLVVYFNYMRKIRPISILSY